MENLGRPIVKNKIEYENCLLINQSAQNKVSNLLVIFVFI